MTKKLDYDEIVKKTGFDPMRYDWKNNPLRIGTDANPNPLEGLMTSEEAEFMFREVCRRVKKHEVTA